MKIKIARAAGQRAVKRWGAIFCGVAVAMLVVTVGAHGEEPVSAAQQSTETLFKWINFILVAGVIAWISWKRAPAFFGKRADAISSAVKKATDARVQADRLLREAEGKLANLEKEVAGLRAAAQRESSAEVERIRALTEGDAAKIDASAKAEIGAAERAARLELKALAAQLAVSGAESLLAQQLTPESQDLLINNFVKSLESRPN